MIITAAYRQADQDYLTRLTVKELAEMLTIAGIKGRSKATTKTAKIDLLMTAYFGYSVDESGNITQDMPEVVEVTEITAKTPKTTKKQPTRAALNEKANVYDWMVVNLGDRYAIQHSRARSGDNMVTARSLSTIARRLSKLIKEWQYAYLEGTRYEFCQKYTAKR